MIPIIRPVPKREPTIVWLASYPKSGSTWIRMFIHAYVTDGTVDINKVTHYSDMNEADYSRVSCIPLEELNVDECFHLRNAALFRLQCIKEDKIVKTHCCNGVIHGSELIPQPFTKAAIYVARDPRDVAVSYADHMGISIDATIRKMGDFRLMERRDPLRRYMSSWSQHVESWARPLPYKVIGIRYEDMQEHPRKVFGMIAKFVTDYPLDEGRLDKAIEACSFESLKKQEEENGFLEKSNKQKRFFREGKSTWRDVLTKKQVRKIMKNHGDTMKRAGYS